MKDKAMQEIEENPWSLETMQAPSDALIDLALEKDDKIIALIEEKGWNTPERRKKALQADGLNFVYLPNISQDEIILALTQEPKGVSIIDPALIPRTPEMFKHLLSANTLYMSFLNLDNDEVDWTDEDYLNIIKEYPKMLMYIKNPCEDIQLAAIASNPKVFEALGNNVEWTEEAKALAKLSQ